eukprot:148939-Prymnesium_polylepis.1
MCVRGARWVKSDANSFGSGLHHHAPPGPAPSTTARACLNALTAHGSVKCVSVLLGGGAWGRGATRLVSTR